MKVNVAIVDAFVDGNHGGNPAGVVLNAEQFDSTQKLAIARQVGLSETAFVSPSNSADFKLDFFTPQKQIAHCGHATIATFSLLSQRQLVTSGPSSKETIDGNRDIEVDGDYAYMAQRPPAYTTITEETTDIAASLGIDTARILSTPTVVNTGNSFLIVGVHSTEDLRSLTPNLSAIEQLSEKYDLIGYYVFTLETNVPERQASTRMFAPRYGIAEESATGMAAGPLACYLHDYLDVALNTFSIEQGYAMTPPSPSCIDVVLTTKNTDIVAVKAGGVGKPSRYVEVEI